MRSRWVLVLGMAVGGCCDGDDDPKCPPAPMPPPWNGHEVVVSCTINGYGTDYTYGCGPHGPCHDSDHSYGWHSCVRDLYSPYPWETDYVSWELELVDVCQAVCESEITADAAELGRGVETTDCAGATGYKFVDDGIMSQGEPSYLTQNCPEEAWVDPDAPQTVTWAPVSGSAVRASGGVAYALGAPDRDGRRTLTLEGSRLAVPFTFTTSLNDATALLGYPIGTLVTVDSVQIATASTPLDRSGVGTFGMGSLWFTVHLAVRKPGEATATSATVSAPNPWAIKVTATERGFSMSTLTDPFGGTLTSR